VLEACRRHRPDNIVITSTSEVYGTAQYVPIDEKHPMVGQSPYSATKIAADQIAISYHRSFSLPVKIARPFNTYGPRQSARAIVPSIILQLLGGATDLRLGNLDPTRDLTFVEDTVDGFLAIASSEEFIGSVTNIGSGAEISIGDLVKLISGCLKLKPRILSEPRRVRPRDSEVERLLCDNSKLVENTAWRTKHTLEQGIIKTIAWIRKNESIYKTGLYNV
jgi:dTDP-glucose 4,6-dehydratase